MARIKYYDPGTNEWKYADSNLTIESPDPGSGGNVAYDEAQNLTDEQKAQARENIGAQPKGNYLTEVPEGYAKTEDIPTDAEIIQLIKNNAPEPSGGGIAVTGAHVGQTVKISAVDENGVPTAWEPTDFPSGGGEFGELELIVNHTVTAEEAEASSFMFTKEKYPLIDGQRFLLARITKPTGVSAWMKLKAGSTIIASWNSNTQLCFTTFQLALNGYWFGGVMDGSNPNGGATIPLASFVGKYKAYDEIGGTPYVYYDSLQLYSYMAFLPEGTIIEIYGGR